MISNTSDYTVTIAGSFTLLNNAGVPRLRLLEYLPTYHSPVGLFRVDGIYKLYNLYLGSEVIIPAMVDRYCQVLATLVYEEFGYKLELTTWGNKIDITAVDDNTYLQLGDIPIGVLDENNNTVDWMFNIPLTEIQINALNQYTQRS